MRRFVIFALVVIISTYATNVNAYNWIKEYEFPATRLVKVTRGKDNYDHMIYSFTDAQRRSALLFVCHGVEINGEYRAYMDGELHSDYATAVDNIIRRHIKSGEVSNDFEKVYFHTCHAGYAPQKTVMMPILNKPLQMALYNKGVQAHVEYFDSQGRVYALALWQDHPERPGTDGVDDVPGLIIAGDSEEEF